MHSDLNRLSIFSKTLFDTVTKLLPAYMVPSFIFLLETLPMTANGKVDKQVLANFVSEATPEYLDLFANNAEIHSNTEELSETESKIADAVATVTQISVANIGCHTSFYRLGIDSILVISLSRQLKLAGLGQVDISVILKNDTVSRLAAAINHRDNTGVTNQEQDSDFEALFPPEFISQIKRDAKQLQRTIRKILPCTPLQEAMLSQVIANDHNSYFNHLTFEISGNIAKLKSAWETMLARQDILRTWFQPTNDARYAFAQIVLDSAELPWSSVECPSTDVDAVVERQKTSILSAAKFSLPYAFIELQNSTTGKSELHLLIHHALYDGEAMSQLLQEVEQAVLGLPLPSVVPFVLYIEQMAQADIEAEDQFWGSYLSGFSPTYLVAPAPNMEPTRPNTCTTCLDIPLSRVMDSCKTASVTLLSLLQAAWAKLMFSYSGSSDICFGDVSSCRTLPVDEAERIIGPCFNTLPLRVKLDRNTVNCDLMLQLRKSKADMLPYQLTSLRRLQSRFSPNGSRLFDSLLLLQRSPQQLNKEIWKLVDESGNMDFPFICEIVPDSDKDILQLHLYCNGPHVPKDGLSQMLEGYMDSIRHILQYPHARTTDISMLEGGVPTFLSISMPVAEKQTIADEPLEWSNEALEVRKLVAALARIDPKNIKPTTTIYKLGLDSINAIQIASNLRTRGYDIAAGDLLEYAHVQQFRPLLSIETICSGLAFVMSKDEMFPFAMVTYKPGILDLPWHDHPSGDGYDLVKNYDKPNGTDALDQLHRPPWFLTVQTLSTHTIVHFSALHALYDAHSLNLILSEVSRFYNGDPLPEPVPISPVLASIVAKNAREVENTENVWDELCRDMPVTKFPDLNPRRTDKREIRTLTKLCSKSLSSIYKGCAESEVTLQAVGQAAWARLLASYIGESDITYGVVLSGRGMPGDAQNAIFPCLTTLPSCYIVEGSNKQLVQAIMRLNSLLIKGQHVPLSKLQRIAGSDTALFDTLFVYQKFTPTVEGKQLWTTIGEKAVTDYPVSIELTPKLDKLEFCITFRDDILPVDQAQLLLSQLDWLLMDSLFSPESDCTSAQTMDRALKCAVPRKDVYITAPVSLLHQFVEIKAIENPSKNALEFASRSPGSDDILTIQSWTFKEFNDQGNKYANLLLQLGASVSRLIGICFDKCPEAYFAILAILKIGCAYLALDPGAPIARKQFIMEDSGSKLLLCTSDKKEELLKIDGVKVIALDDIGLLDNISCNSPVLEHPVSGDDTCYCLYTSGSTGTPKGCEITHSNAIQAMLSFQRLFAGHWDDTSRWLQFASFHFDVSVLEQYWSWSVGICVTSCPRDVLFEDLAGTIRELEITHIDLTPSLARLLHPDEVPSLCRGVFITGGEALKQEILDAWGSKQVIYNGYGPTEVTIGCTMLPRVTKWDKPSNIGPQFDNVGSFVFKPGTNIPVLKGGIGELCVSGPLVGRGYLNRPQLTEERFQYLDEWGERVYRTGDLVRMLYDNSFCFLGRMDDQVKLRGQRLEIEEINHVIKSASKILGETVTMVLNHPSAGKEHLVSFITRGECYDKESTVTIDMGREVYEILGDVRRACNLNLPGYMIPTHIIPLTRFPLSPNNKIEIKRLKEIYANLTPEQMQRLISHGNEKGEITSKVVGDVISIVSELAGCDAADVGPWSNIFQLGLDSISVISLARALKQAGFNTAQPALIMKNPVISVLSEELQLSADHVKSSLRLYQNAKQSITAFAHRHLGSLAEELCIPTNIIEAVSPCTPLQDGMIYRCLESQGRTYLSTFTFELFPHVSIPRLMATWRKVQGLCQILRTKFVATMDGYAQIVLKEDNFPWFELETSDDSELRILSQKRYTKWSSTLHHFTDRVWEIGTVSGPSGTLMCLNMFHGLYDGISLALLLEKVVQVYGGEENIETSLFFDVLPFGPLCKQPDAEAFWVQHLRDVKPQTLPSNSHAFGESQHVLTIEINALEHFQEVRRNLNVTEQAVIHGCWLDVFERQFGFIPTLGVVSSGRSLDFSGAEDVIGPLFNTVPCHIPIPNTLLLSELVRACHEFHASMVPFQHTPLRDIIKWTCQGVENPLFDNLFVFQKALPGSHTLCDSLWVPVASHGGADYPLSFEATDNGNATLTASIVVKEQILSSEAAIDLLNRFKDTLLRFLGDQSVALRPSGDRSIANSTSPGKIHTETEQYSRSKSVANGHSHFEWSPKATQLRQEIVGLANIDEIAVNESTSIFELGLDSIDAIKLSSRLKKSGLALSVSKIMHCQTIEAMIKEIVDHRESDNHSFEALTSLENALRASLEADAIDLTSVQHVLPTTPLQEGMLAEMIASDYMHYFNQDVLEIEEHVDIGKLKNAFEKTIEDNPILRTAFTHISDPNLPFSFAQLVMCSGKPMDWAEIPTSESSIDHIFEDERRNAVNDSLRLPLFKIRLLRNRDQRLLHISIAHALYDGWALDLLHQTIAANYFGETTQPSSYHATLENIVNSSNRVKASQFWKGYLKGVQPTSFPTQTDSKVLKIYRDERTLPLSNTKIVSFCRKHKITPQTLGLTCWLMTLAGYVHQLDLVCGTVMSGRDTAAAEEVMFPTMSSVAIRGILHGSRHEMLQYIQEMMGGILENQHYPLRKVKSLSGIGNQPLFNTLFIYQKRPVRDHRALYKSVRSSSDVEYPICVEMELSNDAVVWRVACKSTIISLPGTTELLDRISHCFTELLDNPNNPTVEFNDETVSICGLTFSTISAGGLETSYSSQSSDASPEGWTLLERDIRSVLSSVANTSEMDIGKHTTLFHIGLDSISAIKVSALLKKKSVILAVSDMLRAGSVEKMAQVARISQSKAEVLDSKLICSSMLREVGIDSLLRHHKIVSEVEGVMPATPGQIYMLEMWKHSKGKLFFPSFLYRLEGSITHEELEKGWSKTLDRLPILRTTFLPTGHSGIRYIQAVFRTVENPIIWRNNLQHPSDRQTETNARFVTLYASKTVSETIVMLHIHHALYDAVSLEQIINMLSANCYPENIQPTSILDMSEFIAFSSISSPPNARKDFWTKYLSKANLEHDTPPEASFDWLDMTETYCPSLISSIGKLDKAGRKHGVSIQSIFLAAYAKVHARLFPLSPGSPLIVGIYLANRSHAMEGLPNLPAPTLNIVPLCIENLEQSNIIQLARNIQNDIREISNAQNSFVSLYEIAEWTGIKVDTVVNFLRYPDSTEQSDAALSKFIPFEELDMVDILSNAGTADQATNSRTPTGIPVETTTLIHSPSWLNVEAMGPEEVYKNPIQPSIDIEAAIRDGSLDVGIFGPSSRVDTSTANAVLEELKCMLQDVSTSTGDQRG
ncbi:predicted protein [Uncinocarpus reesii 1704]|uniref:Nonribosomal peptide synthetase sidC n=1 Tax=Uncinocarpus reesii (strain UAMH 1704) TaxID=336963 RepID=C4JEY9_UNCRE|nr:uncharacterized protein UREG_00890 [Uncinocarpus reesii 1704]EEP76042.1 predicted protein [Uncinocarpus reesii 1704]